MKIVGGRDYYDGGMVFGQDTDVVYVRNGRTIQNWEERINGKKVLPDPEYDSLRSVLAPRSILIRDRAEKVVSKRTVYGDSYNYNNYLLEPFTILVAGILYTGMRVIVPMSINPYTPELLLFAWSNEALKRILKADVHVTSSGGSLLRVDARSVEYFKSSPVNSSVVELCQDKRITIAYVAQKQMIEGWDNKIILDGVHLGRMGFATCVDPTTCFQNIYSWVSGVLSDNSNRMVQITDEKIMLKKHGMDHTSFRKPKEQYQ